MYKETWPNSAVVNPASFRRTALLPLGGKVQDEHLELGMHTSPDLAARGHFLHSSRLSLLCCAKIKPGLWHAGLFAFPTQIFYDVG